MLENPTVDAIMALHISPGGPKVGSFSVYNGIATTAFDLYNVEVNGRLRTAPSRTAGMTPSSPPPSSW